MSFARKILSINSDKVEPQRNPARGGAEIFIMRVVGINIPDNKRIEIALTYIYGIGRSLSPKILKELKIDANKKASDLSQKEV